MHIKIDELSYATHVLLTNLNNVFTIPSIINICIVTALKYMVIELFKLCEKMGLPFDDVENSLQKRPELML